jgi:hypothetical protein
MITQEQTKCPLGPPPAVPLVARNIVSVKAELHQNVDELVEGCEDRAKEGASTGDLERTVGAAVGSLGQQMIALVFARACHQAMLEDMRERGLSSRDVRLRTDKDGYITVHTTFGPVTFPIFAYRDMTTPLGAVTRCPARRLFPFHRKCRSSPLCLEWEARLGAQHPFRKAEELFHFFTRGASTVEDNTISRHILQLSSIVAPDWLYRKPQEICETLVTKATRDKETEQPLIYLSTDAHALRRYVGATWATNWKMINGIRLWCEDATTGDLIHLGGEFTWGDCRAVGARIKELIEAGILPGRDGPWADVDPLLVFVSDGAEWIVDHVISPLLGDANVILDPYHVLEWIAEMAAKVFGAGKPQAKALIRRFRELLLGTRKTSRTAEAKPRRGHRKRRGARNLHAHDHHHHPQGTEQENEQRRALAQPGAMTAALLDLLADVPANTDSQQEAVSSLVERLAKNCMRMDYELYLQRGMQIGSGAMESMHRSASQRRTKLPGAWLEETSLSVLRFRMLELSGRWDEFWMQPDIVKHLAHAFNSSQPEERRCAA